jgi:hypothetical protein
MIRPTQLILSFLGVVALGGCASKDLDPSADIQEDLRPSDAETSDVPIVECCAINAQQNFCDTEIPFGGAMTPGGECWIGSHDGGGPADGWGISTDEFGCPVWMQMEPATIRCAEPDAARPDAAGIEVDDTGDAGDVAELEDSADVEIGPDAAE